MRAGAAEGAQGPEVGPRVHAGPSGHAGGGGVAVGMATCGNAVRVGVVVSGGGAVGEPRGAERNPVVSKIKTVRINPVGKQVVIICVFMYGIICMCDAVRGAVGRVRAVVRRTVGGKAAGGGKACGRRAFGAGTFFTQLLLLPKLMVIRISFAPRVQPCTVAGFLASWEGSNASIVAASAWPRTSAGFR